MKEIRHLKTMKNNRNLNTKWLLQQNDQNADTTLLHSHDEMYLLFHHLIQKCCYVLVLSIIVCFQIQTQFLKKCQLWPSCICMTIHTQLYSHRYYEQLSALPYLNINKHISGLTTAGILLNLCPLHSRSGQLQLNATNWQEAP